MCLCSPNVASEYEKYLLFFHVSLTAAKIWVKILIPALQSSSLTLRSTLFPSLLCLRQHYFSAIKTALTVVFCSVSAECLNADAKLARLCMRKHLTSEGGQIIVFNIHLMAA